MATQFESADGRIIRVRVPGDPEPDPENPELDDELDEGSETEAVILVPQHNTMTVEGAVAGIGSMVRTMSNGGAQSTMPGNWWHDWGKYVIPMVVLIVGTMAASILLR